MTTKLEYTIENLNTIYKLWNKDRTDDKELFISIGILDTTEADYDSVVAEEIESKYRTKTLRTKRIDTGIPMLSLTIHDPRNP